MKDGTQRIHEQLVQLGTKLGFTVEREVSNSLLALRGGYAPRIDLMWSLPIDAPKRQAIAAVLGRDNGEITHLPVVGIEVEGTDPTTKTMMSDVANIRALGAPLGLLVVSEEASSGIYRRAARAIRTMKQNLGQLSVVPVESTWMPELLKQEWSTGMADLPRPVQRQPRGGETQQWEKQVRQRLRALGGDAGFVVSDPLVPPDVQVRFDAERSRRADGLKHTWDPRTAEPRSMSKASDYLTSCEIDLAWLLALPRALEQLLVALTERDPCLRSHDLVYPELWKYVAAVGFELESQGGKHAGGALLNLAAYCVMGVAWTPNVEVADQVGRTLETYKAALGLRNVAVRT
jgi:hypothetical protein